MLTKPDTCSPCVLNKLGNGFGTRTGPSNADILFVGEALGIQEANTGKPFVGPAGSILNKVFRYVGIDRDAVAIHNIINCQPPNNNLVGTSYEHEAINSCSQYINRTLDEGSYKVVVGLGAVASKQLLGLYGTKGVSIFELHGAPARDKSDQYWVIPTVHPSFILQGGHNMFGVLAFDIMKALEIARDGFDGDKANLIIDPGWAAWDIWVKETIAKAQATQNGLWLAVDIETPLKHKNSDESDNVGFNIADSIYRVNYSCDKDEAITTPFDAQHMAGHKALLAHPKIKKAFWYMNFDKPNLENQGVPVLEPCYDMMWGFHLLQSDLRKGLGFVSPFYSSYGPWKHLTDHKVPVESLTGSAMDNYKRYSAVDGLQTIRNTYGIERDLKAVNLWDIFERHVRDLDRFVLRPAEKVGLLFDKTKLELFKEDLTKEEVEVAAICTKFAPHEIIPPEKTWKTNKAAVDELGRLKPGHKEITKSTMCYVCQSCETINVNKTHNKSKKCFGAKLKFETHVVTKWIKEGSFNPNSPKQVLAYIKYKGHKPGKQKKSLNDSSDIQTLENLKKKHPKDLMYDALMKMRKITKMKGTYCEGILSRGDATNRVHTQYTHMPSTMRLSSKDPNLTNLVAKDKKEDEEEYGKRFRECIIASPGCTLLESDYGGIESVQTGWFAKDPEYIRLAKLSVHAYLTSHVVGKPASLQWDDVQLKGYLNEIKEEYFLEYNKCKRVVHGSAYLLSAIGLSLTYPELFKNKAAAKDIQDILFSVAPGMRAWQLATIEKADTQKYLGGTDHPYNYKHWFYDIINYTRITEAQATHSRKQVVEINGIWYRTGYGRDAKRSVAFYPQSTAGGNIKEAMLKLFTPGSLDYIGDAYYGSTPLRAPIHDSLLLEVPTTKLDFVAEKVYSVMTRPIPEQPMDPAWGLGSHLTIDVNIEVGKNWAIMEKLKIGS